MPYKDTVVGPISASLWLVFGAVLLLLLIACTNITALLLARATQRERDVAIRFSVGASRARAIWPQLTETGLLVFVGAGVGLGVAYGAVALVARAGADLPRFAELSLDWRTGLFSVATAAAVTALCGP